MANASALWKGLKIVGSNCLAGFLVTLIFPLIPVLLPLFMLGLGVNKGLQVLFDKYGI